MVINDALNLTYSYLQTTYEQKELIDICEELKKIARADEFSVDTQENNTPCSYDVIQNTLSKLNEKESIRKNKGVYYTPNEVVQFILANSIKLTYGKLKPENIHDGTLNEIPYQSFCTKKTVFDPTCGAGEYLLAALELKLDLLDAYTGDVTKEVLTKTVSTILGNDINIESVIITEIRLFLCALNRYGIKKCKGLAAVMNQGFKSYDFVTQKPDVNVKYHIIVGNPPYVEDFKSGLSPELKYGNIYANVLKNAAEHLASNGSMGFIIPLSYIATPRMQKIRDDLFNVVTEQYILSYADRPDCLFNSVHQKLCILIGKSKKTSKRIYTGNYQYWYKEERGKLFEQTQVIKNNYSTDGFIPKLGTNNDSNIYKKVINSDDRVSVYAISRTGTECVYVNRRETFWMKAFRIPHIHPEYKVFSFETSGEADYCYCLINSSLFWWYWISTSDCWHVSKELNGFMAPKIKEYAVATRLAQSLGKRLEDTKVYVGTKQTEYEYKHRACVREIHAIDDYINDLYGLTAEESAYIKNFEYRYRTSGGAKANEGS
ncbi:N-6 DNA methylase [Clostridium gasigenes]|uniref:Eco57I restriction-modification methylase domain-containing protein n=1 Tax=Clostridium gasigenes TaxID=94869 RepID=UPI001C0D761F|nr:N-6 DNA methylase [Clostridium gasigenes]MBU3134402.1 N-6 DNA methylase [Clostridium gasigenes]